MALGIFFLISYLDTSSASTPNDTNTYYKSKDAITKKANEVGCVEIDVPGTNADGSSAHIKLLYYRIPHDLNPDKLPNEQLSGCGLMPRPPGGFKTVDAYKQWFKLSKSLIEAPLSIPETGISRAGVCVGDPTHLCTKKQSPMKLNQISPENNSNGYLEVPGPNFAGGFIQDEPSPYVQSVTVTTDIIIPTGPFGFSPTYTPYSVYVSYWAGYASEYPGATGFAITSRCI